MNRCDALIELYDFVSKDCINAHDSIKEANDECRFDDIIMHSAVFCYTKSLLMKISKLLEIPNE